MKIKTDIEQMTRKDFEALPHRDWNKESTCQSILILPYRKLHDSGFRCMAFIAVSGNKALHIISGCSDVIHIDGIGGYGYKWSETGHVPKVVPPSGWSIDCLAKSGLLRMWPSSHKMICGDALSSFEIYALPDE